MDIMKLGILDDKDDVVKVDGNQVHVKRKTGEYAVYTLRLDESNQIVDFDVFAITKGFGSIELCKNADLDDLSELWDDSDD